jgi:hypothetical protein
MLQQLFNRSNPILRIALGFEPWLTSLPLAAAFPAKFTNCDCLKLNRFNPTHCTYLSWVDTHFFVLQSSIPIRF